MHIYLRYSVTWSYINIISYLIYLLKKDCFISVKYRRYWYHSLYIERISYFKITQSINFLISNLIINWNDTVIGTVFSINSGTTESLVCYPMGLNECKLTILISCDIVFKTPITLGVHIIWIWRWFVTNCL